MSSLAEIIAVHCGFAVSDGRVQAMEEEIHRDLGYDPTGNEIAAAVRVLAKRHGERWTPRALDIAAEIREARRGESAATAGSALPALLRRLDAIRDGRQGCNPGLPRRNREGGACRDCERDPRDQAWCVICEPRETRDCAALRGYADRQGVAYRRPDPTEAVEAVATMARSLTAKPLARPMAARPVAGTGADMGATGSGQDWATETEWTDNGWREEA